MKTKLLALAIGLFAVGTVAVNFAVPAQANNDKPVRCWYDKVAKKTTCTHIQNGGLILR